MSESTPLPSARGVKQTDEMRGLPWPGPNLPLSGSHVHKFGIFRFSKGKYLFVKQRQQSQGYLDTMVGLRYDLEEVYRLDSTKL